MNIAIAGAGITGGYLAKVLEQRGISPEVYDGMDHDTRCGCRSCGWGVSRGIETYLADVGLDVNEYLF
jgi:2-polyprenyl-6-methoxyphenol hydroxylase-like FAD-dependent oxidoreductase